MLLLGFPRVGDVGHRVAVALGSEAREQPRIERVDRIDFLAHRLQEVFLRAARRDARGRHRLGLRAEPREHALEVLRMDHLGCGKRDEEIGDPRVALRFRLLPVLPVLAVDEGLPPLRGLHRGDRLVMRRGARGPDQPCGGPGGEPGEMTPPGVSVGGQSARHGDATRGRPFHGRLPSRNHDQVSRRLGDSRLTNRKGAAARRFVAPPQVAALVAG